VQNAHRHKTATALGNGDQQGPPQGGVSLIVSHEPLLGLKPALRAAHGPGLAAPSPLDGPNEELPETVLGSGRGPVLELTGGALGEDESDDSSGWDVVGEEAGEALGDHLASSPGGCQSDVGRRGGY
jgi:hypothetical protein